ncbi:YhcU family protein [Rossellomorea aquimaris]|nr:YhcU family protein [Rossellomorea aquimaris]
MKVKVLLASTHEQEDKIQELIQYMYCTIFPDYFTDDEIEQFEEMQVLHTTTRNFEYFGTLKEAFQVISSLQTLISIVESGVKKDVYEDMFYHNARILQGFGMFFPLSYDQFSTEPACKHSLSIYSRADNHLLI